MPPRPVSAGPPSTPRRSGRCRLLWNLLPLGLRGAAAMNFSVRRDIPTRSSAKSPVLARSATTVAWNTTSSFRSLSRCPSRRGPGTLSEPESVVDPSDRPDVAGTGWPSIISSASAIDPKTTSHGVRNPESTRPASLAAGRSCPARRRGPDPGVPGQPVSGMGGVGSDEPARGLAGGEDPQVGSGGLPSAAGSADARASLTPLVYSQRRLSTRQGTEASMSPWWSCGAGRRVDGAGSR